MAAHLPFKQNVAGSNPAAPTYRQSSEWMLTTMPWTDADQSAYMDSFRDTQTAYLEWKKHNDAAKTARAEMKAAEARETPAHDKYIKLMEKHRDLHTRMLHETAEFAVNPEDTPLTPDMQAAAETILNDYAAPLLQAADAEPDETDPLPVKYRVYIVADERPPAPNDKPLVALAGFGINVVPEDWMLTAESAVAYAHYNRQGQIGKGRIWGVDVAADWSLRHGVSTDAIPEKGKVEFGETWLSDLAGQPIAEGIDNDDETDDDS